MAQLNQAGNGREMCGGWMHRDGSLAAGIPPPRPRIQGCSSVTNETDMRLEAQKCILLCVRHHRHESYGSSTSSTSSARLEAQLKVDEVKTQRGCEWALYSELAEAFGGYVPVGCVETMDGPHPPCDWDW